MNLLSNYAFVEDRDGRCEGRNSARPGTRQRVGAIAAYDASRILPNLSLELMLEQSGDDGVGFM